MIKTCQSCGVTFKADKRRTLCDTCRRAYTLEHQREYQRRYRKENPEKNREYQRCYRKENPEKNREYLRRYRERKLLERSQRT